jgi:hypothetical protein
MNIAQFICFIVVSTSFAQVGDIRLDSVLETHDLSIDSLSKNAEILVLKYPKVYWGNKYNLIIGDFVVAKIKTGIQSTSNRPKNGVNESRTKYKFSIDIKENKEHLLAKVEGKVDQIQHSEFSTYGGILDIFTGVETETIGAEIDNLKTITAKIQLMESNDELWVVELKTSGRSSDFTFHEGLVTNGTRMIRIVQNNVDVPKDLEESPFQEFDFRAASSFRYDFIENGKTIGALKKHEQNSILLDPHVDPVSKLILVSAMIVIEQ